MLVVSFTPPTADTYELRLIDMQGKILQLVPILISQPNRIQEVELSLQPYPAGTYLLSISSDRLTETRTLIKQ